MLIEKIMSQQLKKCLVACTKYCFMTLQKYVLLFIQIGKYADHVIGITGKNHVGNVGI